MNIAGRTKHAECYDQEIERKFSKRIWHELIRVYTDLMLELICIVLIRKSIDKNLLLRRTRAS